MDIVFISPDSSRESYQSLSNTYSAIEPPTWALLLAGALPEFEVSILDPLAEGLSDHEAWLRILRDRPKLICFVVYGQNPNSGSANMAGAVRLARYIKDREPYPIAIIGSHASALPEETLKTGLFDYVLPGNGYSALTQLLPNLPKRGVYWSDRRFRFGGYPWHLVFPLTNYRSYNWFAGYDDSKRRPYAAVYTSIGCNFKCDFCMINLVNRQSEDEIDASYSNTMTYFDPDRILLTFETLADLGVKNVRISDEMFFLNKKHYLPIVNGLIRRKLGLNLWAYARVDTVRPEYLGLFKEAGINWLCLGIESSDTKIRREITKGSYEETDIRQVCREIKDAGINVLANFIFGLPDDGMDSMESTFQLAQEINAEHANFYPCMALPGSPLYTKAKTLGIKTPDTFEGYSFHSYDCQPLPTKYLSPKEVLGFRDEAWLRYNTDPRYLSLVKEKFGQVAVDHLAGQTKINLKRRLFES